MRAHCTLLVREYVVCDLDLLSYLNLQDIVSTDALVMHFVVGIVSITAALVFHKGKAIEMSTEKTDGRRMIHLQSAGSSPRSRNVASDQTTIVLELIGEITSTSAMTKARDIERGT